MLWNQRSREGLWPRKSRGPQTGEKSSQESSPPSPGPAACPQPLLRAVRAWGLSLSPLQGSRGHREGQGRWREAAEFQPTLGTAGAAEVRAASGGRGRKGPGCTLRGADSASTSPTSPAAPFWWGQPSVHAAATGRTGSTWRGRALASASHLGLAASLGSRAEASPAASPFPGPQLCWREGGRSGCGGGVRVHAGAHPRVLCVHSRVLSGSCVWRLTPARRLRHPQPHTGGPVSGAVRECLGPLSAGRASALRPCTGAQMGSAGPHSHR